ncbi:flagellar protein FlgN [Cohnella silvisoli]|uniref:Flagellar protein FlgN n=1 Tax=Cohnella silvisoli TaxID=2873699 RepID=A0ABV1KPM0_9BACL|nr:flagellar protein FlgN [Cohnella silvisoli]MCD9022303.1 flagellar protein FlgN [Cohnella silvisoli]
MNEAVQGILDPIRTLTALYRQLIALGQEKQEAILANHTDVIMQVTNRESKLLKDIASQETLRIASVKRFAAELGIASNSTIRIEQLIQLVHKAALKQALIEAAEDLSEAILRLHEINDRNQQMIKLHLEYINYSIDVIAGPSEEEATYHRSLQEQGFIRMSQFDTKA